MSENNESQERDVLIEGHDYDGIQEYDNPMPRWWLNIFYVTIAWSVFYLAAMQFGWIGKYENRLEKEQAEINRLQAAAKEAAPDVDQAYLESILGDEALLAAGMDAYKTTCAACHADNGGGGIGPNLTDSAWLHGGSLIDIYASVHDGIPAKGMPAWGGTLSHNQVVGIVSYIDTIRNTNVDGGKAPQGDEYVAE